MRPTSFSAAVDPLPWLDGVLLLPPAAIARSFLLQSSAVVRGESGGGQLDDDKEESGWIRETDDMECGTDSGSGDAPRVVHVESVAAFIAAMKSVRHRCESRGLLPLFHYTQTSLVPLILQSGLRMSTQGQGDGGVYFSTKSPVSYGLGKMSYEESIVRDCFGIERLKEFKGLEKLSAVLVYAMDPAVLAAAPGGRNNAKMVPRQTFQDFSLPQSGGDFFLRPDMVLAVFVVDTSGEPPSVDFSALADARHERDRDQAVFGCLEEEEARMKRICEKILHVQHENGNVPLVLEDSDADPEETTEDEAGTVPSPSSGDIELPILSAP